METENKYDTEKEIIMFDCENKLKLQNYLPDLIIDNPGKGNDSIRIYGIRNEIKKHVSIDRKIIAKLLKVNYKTINNWVYNTRDVGIPVEKAILLYSKIKRDPIELFNFSTTFGCTNSKKYNLPKYITPELAYLFGYLMGDGHLANPDDLINNGSRYNAEIRITTEDKEHLIYLKLLFEKYFNYSPHLYKENNFYRFIGRSKVIHRFLSTVCEIPVGNKKSKTLIPKILLGNIGFEKAFISGLIDSDGNIYKDKKGRISLGIKQFNRKLLKECQNILSKLGLTSHIYRADGLRNGKITRGNVLRMYKQKEMNRLINEFQSFKINEVLVRTKKN